MLKRKTLYITQNIFIQAIKDMLLIFFFSEQFKEILQILIMKFLLILYTKNKFL